MLQKHIISAKEFDKDFIYKIFEKTTRLKTNNKDIQKLKGKILATVFYEPSTRTRLSFESAMLRLGGQVITTENASEFSSAIKGETLEDTIRVLDKYADAIVLRHSTPGASKIAAEISSVPIINAGDGNGEHPTQSLLDLYTIFSYFPKLDITIVMVGDLINGRTIHSLSYLLSIFPQVFIIFVSPKKLSIPDNLRAHLINSRIRFKEVEDFNSVINEADVVYQTRIQKERFANKKEYSKFFGRYILDSNIAKKLKRKAVILHPLPRVNEIPAVFDSDMRAKYFEQAANGLFVRMATLLYVFDKTSLNKG